jgi:hypothetical protein
VCIGIERGLQLAVVAAVARAVVARGQRDLLLEARAFLLFQRRKRSSSRANGAPVKSTMNWLRVRAMNSRKLVRVSAPLR